MCFVVSTNRRIVKTSLGCIFPKYRWCGPGCSGPGEPINDVDACCMRHDQCLSRGISSCQCDMEFIKCLCPKINYQSEKGRIAAIMYYAMKFKTFFTCN